MSTASSTNGTPPLALLGRHRRRLLVAALSTSLAWSLGCDNEESSSAAATAADPASKAPGAAAASAAPSDNSATTASPSPAFQEIRDAYELCRKELAADSVANLGACANDLASAAKAAQSGTDADSKAALAELASSASKLADSTASVDVARVAFAETSRTMIATLAAAPTESGGYHVFECAMVEGKPHWVQPDERPENPYQGAKSDMLNCGSEVHVSGMAGMHGDHKGMKHDGAKMKGHTDHDMGHRDGEG
ncbi:MAG: hypothetical protein ACRBN8_39230 [Nannocystales bacterium]